MAGLTDKGFEIKTLETLLEEMKAELKTIFGENFNCEPSTPQGQLIGVISESNANLYEYAEEAYNSFNPDVASGITLDNLVTLNGISRLSATKSKVDLIFTGTDGARIPVDTLVSDGEDIKFKTIEFGTIVNGTLTLKAEAVDEGAISAAVGSLNTIENPITNVDTVTNPLEADLGADAETDAELRARRLKSFSLAGLNSKDSIYSAVANVNRVESVTIFENDTQVDGFNNLPRNSFKCVVYGGNDEDIAKSIFAKKPVGITTVGTTSVQVKDSQGFESTINFTRPTTKDLYIKMTLSTNINYPLDGDKKIKEALVEYIKANQNVGDDVIYSRLFSPINSVSGHSIDLLEISLDGSTYVSANLSVGVQEIVLLDEANIEITT